MKQETEGFPELGRDWIVAVGEGLAADDPFVRSEANSALRDKQAKEDFHAANSGIENGRDVSRFLTSDLREARDDRMGSGDSRRSRSDRLQHLLVVMGQQRLAEKLREAHKGFDDTASKGQGLLAQIAAIRERWEREYQDFLRTAPLHPVTGEAMFRDDEAGAMRTKSGRVVNPEEIEGVDVSTAPSWAAEQAWQGRFTEIDQLATQVENGMSTLDAAQSSMNGNIEKDPDNAEAHIEEGLAVKGRVDRDFGDVGGRLKELKEESTRSIDEDQVVADDRRIDISGLVLPGPVTR